MLPRTGAHEGIASMAVLRLLGAFDLEQERGETLSIPDSCAPVIAYLLCHRDRPADRKALADRLWPDKPGRRARRCLATALWRIRTIPGLEDLFDTSSSTRLRLNDEARIRVDLIEFEDAMEVLLHHRDAPDAQQITRATEAVALYRGDAFEQIDADWADLERERLRMVFVDGLGLLARISERAGDPAGSVRFGARLAQLEPLREDIHRLLMRSYLELGARAKAIAQYRICQGELASALGLEPMEETRALYERMIARADRRRAPDESRRALEIARAVAQRLRSTKRSLTMTRTGLDDALEMISRITD